MTDPMHDEAQSGEAAGVAVVSIGQPNARLEVDAATRVAAFLEAFADRHGDLEEIAREFSRDKDGRLNLTRPVDLLMADLKDLLTMADVTALTKMIEAMRNLGPIEPNSLVVFKSSDPTSRHHITQLVEILAHQFGHIRFGVIAVDSTEALDIFSEDDMNKAGWFRPPM